MKIRYIQASQYPIGVPVVNLSESIQINYVQCQAFLSEIYIFFFNEPFNLFKDFLKYIFIVFVALPLPTKDGLMARKWSTLFKNTFYIKN